MDRKDAYKILAGKIKRWEDNIKVDLKEISGDNVNWIHMTHRPV
jgi:hypothetical protein